MKPGAIIGLLAGAGASAALGAFLMGRAHVGKHVDAYANHWADRPDGGEGVLHYVALGDSAAQGVGASHVSQGYVPRLGRKLAEATGREVMITNLSVSGATTGDVARDQLPQLAELPFTPDLVTMDIGGNDVVFPGHTPSSFEGNLDLILDALPEGSFVGDVPWFALPGLSRQSRQMAGRASVLIEQHGHHLVPLHAVSRAVGSWNYYRFTARDLFHPNDLGYEGWADTFWKVMEESGLLGSLTTRLP